MITGEDVAREAVALTGTPFKRQGRNPASGLDCQGLVVAAVLAAGGALPPEALQPADPNRTRLLAALRRHTEPIRPQPGALAIILRPGWVHMGVLTSVGICHALDGQGVIHHPLGRWADRFSQVRAIPGVIYG